MTVKCSYCGKEFKANPYQKYRNSKSKNRRFFCDNNCYLAHFAKTVAFECAWCGKKVERLPGEIKKSRTGRHFCDHSCHASYYNTKRRKSRRSKCEIMLFNLLKEEFPELTFVPNDKEILEGYEVDIAIPELKVGIEWNGIVHFRPIHGHEKLARIQQIDAEKQEAARKLDISLIVVPDLVSTKSRVMEAFASISKIIRRSLLP